jgi:MerR family transcriptional regulator, light-induced transcriptional regulator
MSSQAPTFNLKAVIKETGLKPDTLRAWERRYGLPQPDRTGSGHRLYSQRDIDTIKWLIERQNEGLSIGRAVDLWRMQETEGQDPLLTNPPSGSIPSQSPISMGETVVELRQAWIEACLNFDETRAEHILTQAFAFYPPEIVCLELLQKGIAEIGQKWYQGEATVQQEHFSSALGIRRLETLVGATPPPSRSGRILTGCPSGELHTFSLLLATLLLRRRGWETIYLGANVPLEHLEKTLKLVKPHLVILASQQLHSAASLLEAAQLLQQEQIILGFGGRIFNTTPPLRERIPGYFLGEGLDQLPKQVEKLFSLPYRLEKAKPLSVPYRKALAHYQEKRGMIEAAVWEQVNVHNGHQALLSTWHQELAANIMAALTLDDMALLGNEISWGKDFLVNHALPETTLSHYLKAYQQAAGVHLDERGQPILEGLAQLTMEPQ